MYGLEQPDKHLGIVRSDGSTRTFDVGDHTYGRQHVYMRDTETGQHAREFPGLVDASTTSSTSASSAP